jgi:uncharacterized protein YdeI (YjbR/CyaY-like superfamily)
MEELYFPNANEWRNWLKEHHSQIESIWLIFYKKSVGKPTMDYESAVEEALCYGWIDSIKKNIDNERYVFKFSPRKDVSKWSESNKKRVSRLMRQKRMTKYGMLKVKAAKANGMWDKPGRPEIPQEIPPKFLSALERNETAYRYFTSLAPSYRKQYIGWIATAKRAETQEQRVIKSIKLLEDGKKLGMV